jgi:hypothetical protein
MPIEVRCQKLEARVQKSGVGTGDVKCQMLDARCQKSGELLAVSCKLSAGAAS